MTFLCTMAYRVFYHDLLITKLHHIDYENYTDGIHHPKDMLHGFQKISMEGGDGAMTRPYVKKYLVFGSPVWSGFLTPRAIDRDRNRSFYFWIPKKTGPNRCGLVHISFLRLRNWLGPVKVQTG